MLNDFQVDPAGEHVYIAETSPIRQRPALVVYDVARRTSRRVLDGHPSVQAGGWVTHTPERTMKVLGADYDVPGRALRMTLTVTNNGETPLRIGEFTTAGIRFLNKVGVANNLDPNYPAEIMATDGLNMEDDSPILPGETKDIKLDSRDSLWEFQRLMDLVHDPEQRFGGLVMSWDDSGNRHINSISGAIIPVFTRAQG